MDTGGMLESPMPDRTKCPWCDKIGLVRYENVIKGGKAERRFYCGSCNRSWSVTEEGETRQSGPPIQLN